MLLARVSRKRASQTNTSCVFPIVVRKQRHNPFLGDSSTSTITVDATATWRAFLFVLLIAYARSKTVEHYAQYTDVRHRRLKEVAQ